ncbi:MAG: MerR family transcriptional regulator [Bacteroidetes bacterium]|nr:MerR family transcriptional regulator [Bacteroidota bacterium]MBP7478756.1 MerR family transcriptional regulator [Chitinophagales bacterium]
MKEIAKLYYTIGEAAEILQTTTSQIRFWEGEFESLKIRKTKKGDRLFVLEDIEQLKLIQYLLKEKGYTIEGARNQLKSNPEDASNHYKVIESLRRLKQFLVELKAEL